MKIKKKYYKYIVVGGFIIFSSIILFKPKEKVPIKPHYVPGDDPIAVSYTHLTLPTKRIV